MPAWFKPLMRHGHSRFRKSKMLERHRRRSCFERDSLPGGGWQGGDEIVKDKNDARRAAASDVAAKYAAEIRKKQHGSGKANGGRSQIASVVQTCLRPSPVNSPASKNNQIRIVNMAEQARRESIATVKRLEQCGFRPGKMAKAPIKAKKSKPYSSSKKCSKKRVSMYLPAGETMKANILNAASGFGQQYSALVEQLQWSW